MHVYLLTALRYLNRPSFWGLLVVGWLIAAIVLSIFARVFGAFEEMSRADLWVTGISIHALALLCGVSFARSQIRKAEGAQRSDD